jgi:hypothetical protein
MFLDVLYFLFENVETHVEEKTLDLVVRTVVQWIGPLQVHVDSVIGVLPELVILMQVWESL